MTKISVLGFHTNFENIYYEGTLIIQDEDKDDINGGGLLE